MPQTTGFTIWFTGMSGAGKTTLANYLADRFRVAGKRVEVLDQNDLAELLVPGPLLSKEDRGALTRRLGWGAKLLARNDAVAIVAAVSPYREPRDAVRREIGRFVEIFCDCPTEKLIERDTTGQYKKALAGHLPNFTGVTDPYETPQLAEAIVHTDAETVEESATKILQSLVNIGYLKPDDTKAMLGKRMKARPVAKPAKGKAKPEAKAAAAAKADKARRPAKEKAAAKARPAKREAPKAAKKARR